MHTVLRSSEGGDESIEKGKEIDERNEGMTETIHIAGTPGYGTVIPYSRL